MRGVRTKEHQLPDSALEVATSPGKDKHSKPILHPGMSSTEYRAYYWVKADLVEFARRLGLSTRGHKPELSARIDRRLQGMPEGPEPPKQVKGPRDSDKPLRRGTPVVNYKSDDRTRAFFESEIGSEFHFTYRLNQYRLVHDNLTYGDLIDVWVAERDRRRHPNYRPPIAEHGKYNRFIRDFFADQRNTGRSLREAAASWNKIKNKRGDPATRPWRDATAEREETANERDRAEWSGGSAAIPV